MVDFDGGALYCDDNSDQDATDVHDWVKFTNEASRSFGKDIDVARHHKKRMIDAGFQNVREEVYRVRRLSY